ncbi:beta-phosphoglucomutase [Tuanshanicoccus lijuaniae]|uniref:beta-phosphoglucomutase n=1 Tax=Aerococcaceae bacterium zg-1292 TaxID=2774330 RepID=UPI001934FF36|nr:beta-phosphoglucomutase [Aerococcaceae bacterium zg-1292]QQA36840.1 beta-phosphoglucomutase [Aerococcaceae bacterium zg-1292]
MKGVLFDLDGIIADTSVYHFKAWKQLIAKHFHRELPDELEEQTKGVSREDSLRVILTHLDISINEAAFAALCAEKNTAYIESLSELNQNNILPGIYPFLNELKNAQIKIALASASKNGPIILEKLGLIHHFDAIADPSRVNAGKPAPDIFLAAASALNLDPTECIGIEDSIAGVTAINTSGALSVAVGGQELNHADYRVQQTSDLTYDLLLSIWKHLRQK